MPAGVVVVKRTRRRAFAVLWTLPAWLRSAVAVLRRGSAAAPLGLAERGPCVPGFPRLALEEGGEGRCTACGDCVPACPSHCLSVVAGHGGPLRLALDPGACIGCGRCVEVCPESALIAAPGPGVLVTNSRGGVAEIDLLVREGAAIVEAGRTS